MLWVWLIVIIIALLLEWITLGQLVSIWAALGGVAALISYLCGANETVQIIIFFAATILSLVLTRPFVKKMTKFQKTATNADMTIGKVGKVVDITNESEGLFQVKVDGCVWSAIMENRQTLPLGSDVAVQRIEGVKLIVIPLSTKQTVQAK